MLPHYPHYVLRCISQLMYLTFDIFARNIVKGPGAKVARQCHRFLLTAGVGNTQPGEEKTSCHIFSVDLLQTVNFGLLTLILYCIAAKKEKEEKILKAKSYLL